MANIITDLTTRLTARINAIIQSELRRLRVCAAPDCEQVFLKETNKRFCSQRCQSRVFMRDYRSRGNHSTLPDTTQVESLGLSKRALDACRNVGASTVGELRQVPDEVILRTKGVGPKALAELRAAAS